MPSLRTKNLNLIPILQALLREESVAKAAEQVCLSQSAMSGALARIRETLDDPILYRSGKSMRLTPRAQKLRKQLDLICEEIEQLFQPESFDPAKADHYFVIAAPDYLAFLLSGPLLVRLREEAPNIRIRFVDVPNDLPNWLENASVDLAVCGNFGLWPGLQSERLFRERIVAAVAKNHPLLKRARPTSADLMEFPSLNYNTSVTMSKLDTKPKVGIPCLDWVPQISTGQFVDAVLLAVDSPVVARAPASLVARLSKMLPLATIELDGERTDHDAAMFWSPMCHDAPEHVWLRSVVRECLAPWCQDEE